VKPSHEEEIRIPFLLLPPSMGSDSKKEKNKKDEDKSLKFGNQRKISEVIHKR
jgi:hypothetical protein